MTRAYSEYPQVSAGDVRNAFEYDNEFGRLLRKTSTGGLKRCGSPTGKNVYIMWNGTRWPMLLLIWLYVHKKWPDHKLMHLRGDRNHAGNIVEREPPIVTPRHIAYSEPVARVPAPGPNNPSPMVAIFDFSRIISTNQPVPEGDDNA